MSEWQEPQQISNVAIASVNRPALINQSSKYNECDTSNNDILEDQNIILAETHADKVAVEINNLFCTILSNAEFLRDNSSSPELTRYLTHHISCAAERGAGLMRKFLLLK